MPMLAPLAKNSIFEATDGPADVDPNRTIVAGALKVAVSSDVPPDLRLTRAVYGEGGALGSTWIVTLVDAVTAPSLSVASAQTK